MAKVIAKTKDNYLMEVSHTEIEKFLGLYYGGKEKLAIGDECDFGKGYDYASEITDSLNKTENFVKSSEKIIQAIANGFGIRLQVEQEEGK